MDPNQNFPLTNPHVIWWTQVYKGFQLFLPLATSRVLMDPNFKPHWVHQITWVKILPIFRHLMCFDGPRFSNLIGSIKSHEFLGSSKSHEVWKNGQNSVGSIKSHECRKSGWYFMNSSRFCWMIFCLGLLERNEFKHNHMYTLNEVWIPLWPLGASSTLKFLKSPSQKCPVTVIRPNHVLLSKFYLDSILI